MKDVVVQNAIAKIGRRSDKRCAQDARRKPVPGASFDRLPAFTDLSRLAPSIFLDASRSNFPASFKYIVCSRIVLDHSCQSGPRLSAQKTAGTTTPCANSGMAAEVGPRSTLPGVRFTHCRPIACGRVGRTAPIGDPSAARQHRRVYTESCERPLGNMHGRTAGLNLRRNSVEQICADICCLWERPRSWHSTRRLHRNSTKLGPHRAKF